MRYESIRCDFCKREIYYTENGKKVSQHFAIEDIINVERVGIRDKFLCDKQYCSSECLKFAAEEIILTHPTDMDYLKALAEKNNLDLVKKPEILKKE